MNGVYDRISLDVIWHAIHHDLPGLKTAAGRTVERLKAKPPAPS